MGRAAAVLLLLAAVVTSGAAATGERPSRPTLRLTSGAPLRIAGSSFLAGERVRVSAVSTRQASKAVVANMSGRFTVTLNIGYDRCNGLLVTAVGSRGSRTTLKRPELMCPPQL